MNSLKIRVSLLLHRCVSALSWLLVLLVLSSCADSGTDVSASNGVQIQSPSSRQSPPSSPDTAASEKPALEIAPGVFLTFSQETIGDVADFSEQYARQNLPSVISYYNDWLYYLSCHNGVHSLRRTDSTLKTDENLFETALEDIASFCVVDENEFLLFFEREHALGAPYYETEPYLYRADTQSLIPFAQQYGLADVPSRHFFSMSFYDGWYYFKMGENANGQDVRPYRAKRDGNSIQPLNAWPARYDSGNFYYIFANEIYMQNSAMETCIPIASLQGDRPFSDEQVFFDRQYMRIMTTSGEGKATIVTIDLLSQQITHQVEFTDITEPYPLQGGFVPVPSGYRYEAYVYDLYPDGSGMKNYDSYTIQVACYSLDAVLTATFPPVKMHAGYGECYVVLDNTLYYLEMERDNTNKIIYRELSSVIAH